MWTRCGLESCDEACCQWTNLIFITALYALKDDVGVTFGTWFLRAELQYRQLSVNSCCFLPVGRCSPPWRSRSPRGWTSRRRAAEAKPLLSLSLSRCRFCEDGVLSGKPGTASGQGGGTAAVPSTRLADGEGQPRCVLDVLARSRQVSQD